MNNLLGTIILVLPGIVATYLALMIGPSESRPKTDFERTVIGLLFGMPGILLAWGLLSLGANQKLSFEDFETIILKMPCFIYYMLLVFIVALSTALWWDRNGRKLAFSWAKKEREGHRPTIADETAWEQFVGNEKEAYIRVYPLGKKECAVLGIFKASWKPGSKDKGMLLTCTDELEVWDDYFKNPIRTYIDTVNNMVYELFPPSAFDDAKQRERNDC